MGALRLNLRGAPPGSFWEVIFLQLYLRVRQNMVICVLVELICDLLDRGITYIVDYELSVFIYDA